jgi:hypothetical protein
VAILLECCNVIVSKAVVAARYPGGVSGYRADCPNGTYTEDEHLTRVSFMGWQGVEAFVARLVAAAGLVAADVAVVDTAGGPIGECDWLEWTCDGLGSRCWLRGTPEGALCRVASLDLDALLASLAEESGTESEAEPGATAGSAAPGDFRADGSGRTAR